MSVITVNHLSHTYDGVRRAVDDVSFDVQAGEIFGLLGPNGSGKTTIVRVLATMLAPGDGSARICNVDVAQEAANVRRRLGVVFQMPSLDVKLTARENMAHQGHLYGLRGASLAARIDEGLARFDLAERAGELVEKFSGGMRRRVELAKALLHRPSVVIMDEPSTGLDPAARNDLWRILDALGEEQGVTILLTTHLMDEADRCDRLAVMAQGKLVALDTPEALKSRVGGDVIVVEPDVESADTLAAAIGQRFTGWRHDTAPRVVNERVHMERDHCAAFVPELSAAFANRIKSVTVGRPTLEDAFLHLTGKPMREAEHADIVRA